MSWSDQDIDKLFQQAGQPEIPPFQESFWEEIEGQLPEQKRRKIAVWWRVSGVAALVVLLASGMYIAYSETSGTTVALKNGSVEKNYVGSTQTTETPASGKFTESHVKDVFPQVETQQTTLPVHDENPEKQRTEAVEGTDELSSHDLTMNSTAEHVIEKPVTELLPIALKWPQLSLKNLHVDAPEYKPTRFYVQAGAGIGLSSRKNVPKSSDILNCYMIGGGLYKKIDNVVLTLGVQGRVDFVRNIRYTYFPDGTSTKRIDADYRQLYSVEMPASIGFVKGRNLFAFNVNAGLQAGVFGELKETNNDVLVRSENTFVRVDKKATTLTMELGCSYLRTVSPDWYLGAGLNADIIGPFNSSSYAGQQRILPLNAQVFLRRTF